MPALARLAGIICAVAVCADGAPKDKLPGDLAIFLGIGETGKPGQVVQLDQHGRVLGVVELPAAPYSLAALDDGLLVALPGAVQVVKIDATGRVETIARSSRTLPLKAPISVATVPGKSDILVADNVADVVWLVPEHWNEGAAGTTASQPLTLLRIKGYELQAQDMSVAMGKDGYVLLAASGPDGVYRFRGGPDATLGNPLLPDAMSVAVDPKSMRWIAAVRDELVVFRERREEFRVRYPKGFYLYDTVAFGPGGELVIGLRQLLRPGELFTVNFVDLRKKDFHALFDWNKGPVKSLAIAKRANWPKVEGK